MASILQLEGLTRRFGGVTAVDGLALSVGEGELISISDPNDAGKTTVFTGLPAEQRAAPGFARIFQYLRVFGNLSMPGNVLVGAHPRLAAVQLACRRVGTV